MDMRWRIALELSVRAVKPRKGNEISAGSSTQIKWRCRARGSKLQAPLHLVNRPEEIADQHDLRRRRHIAASGICACWQAINLSPRVVRARAVRKGCAFMPCAMRATFSPPFKAAPPNASAAINATSRFVGRRALERHRMEAPTSHHKARFRGVSASSDAPIIVESALTDASLYDATAHAVAPAGIARNPAPSPRAFDDACRTQGG